MIMSECAAQAFDSVGGATNTGAETPATNLIGTTLEGAYRITRLIAEGGMSAVYEAVQLRLNQRLAVKVMARELSSNQEALGRFQREADITSRLRHPHLVTVMDFGTAPAGQPYLVMEYLEGIDLDHRIRQVGQVPLATAVHITKQVAAGLAAAHDQSVVHRDLKPANIFLVELPGEPDFAKVLDFGISKVRAANTQLTKASSIIGTPNYMAPEQATGMLEEIDHRTDQWALACIVWEMLSGRPPFAADDMSAVFYQVIHLDPQPLRKQAPDVPEAVEAVLRRALSKNIGDRFPSVREFSNALAEAAERPTPTAKERTSTTGTNGVERRRRVERRRTAATDGVSDQLPSLNANSFWKKVKPIHALSCLTIAVVVAVLATLHWSQAKAAAPPPPPTAKATPQPAPNTAPSPTTNTATPKPTGVEAPVAREVKAPAPARSPKAKSVTRDNPSRDQDPFEATDPPARVGARHGVSAMPSHKSHQSAGSDFVDPFGP
jgi:eukaryotic-like serine/threonine-protein kinase